MIMGCPTGSLEGPSFQVSEGIFSWSNGQACGLASKMTGTLTVKQKDLRVLFYERLPGTGVRCRSRNLIYKNRKVASSQARMLTL